MESRRWYRVILAAPIEPSRADDEGVTKPAWLCLTRSQRNSPAPDDHSGAEFVPAIVLRRNFGAPPNC